MKRQLLREAGTLPVPSPHGALKVQTPLEHEMASPPSERNLSNKSFRHSRETFSLTHKSLLPNKIFFIGGVSKFIKYIEFFWL